MSPVAAVLLSCVIAGVVGNHPPGLKASISHKGLKYANDLARYEILELARNYSIPDIKGEYSMLLGTVYFTAYSLYIIDINLGSMYIHPEMGDLEVSLSEAEITVHGHWKDELGWLGAGDSGELEVRLQRLSLKLSIYIGYDSTGKPTVHTSGSYPCTFSVGKVWLWIRGSWIYNWIYENMKEDLEDMIKDKLRDQVCSQLIKQVNTKAAEKLRYLKVVRPITKYTEIDLGLTSQPECVDTISTFHKGTVYETAHPTEPPFNVTKLPEFDFGDDKMVFFWITDYVANSACYVLHYTQFFRYLLTEDNIPAGVNLNLNTSGFQMMFLIPQLSKMYPNRMMEIKMTTTAPPKVTFGVNVSVAMEGYVSAYVVQPNRSLTYVFTLDATVNMSAKLSAYKTKVRWDNASISFDVKLLKSAIRDFKIDDLRQKLKLALKMFIMPKVQEMGKVGIPLPSLPLQGYALYNLDISHRQNFVRIGADITYHTWLRNNLSESRRQQEPSSAALFD